MKGLINGKTIEHNAGESPGIYWIDIWPVDPFMIFMDKSTRILHKQCDITKLHKPDDPKLLVGLGSQPQGATQPIAL